MSGTEDKQRTDHRKSSCLILDWTPLLLPDPHPEVADGDDDERHDVLEGHQEDAVDPEEPRLHRNLK